MLEGKRTPIPGQLLEYFDNPEGTADSLSEDGVPKRIIRVDSLSLLPVGKVDKMVLRTIAAEQLGPELAAVVR